MCNPEIFDGIIVAIGKSPLYVEDLTRITASSRIEEDLGAEDSSLWISLLASIARQFGLACFTGGKRKKLDIVMHLFRTVDDLCDLVEARLCEKRQAV